jgi:hypothetical protein
MGVMDAGALDAAASRDGGAAELAARGRKAAASGAWSEAIACWRGYVDLRPRSVAGAVGLGHALCMVRHVAAAEAVVGPARIRFPDDVQLAVISAHIAQRGGHETEALRRWQAVLALAPDHQAARLHIERIEAALANAAVQDSGLREMFDGFTSLGRNCEFGLLQKSFGSDQGSLFRWAQTHPNRLAQLLRKRLAGLGDLDGTALELSPTSEYHAKDTATGVIFHTATYKADGDETAIKTRLCRRLRLLRDKLLHELGEARQIYVCQHRDLADQQALRIHDALLGFGPNRLMCVRAAVRDEAPGSYRLLRPGLMLGVISHEGCRGPSRWDICTSEWQALCEAAHGLWRQ